MSDKINSLTVVLGNDVSASSAEMLREAILQLRGVISVDYNVSDVTTYVAQERARRELTDAIWLALQQKGMPR